MPEALAWDSEATRYPFHITLEPAKAKVYLSKLWIVSAIYTAVANDGFADMTINTPREIQLTALVAAGADAYVNVFSGVTASGGTAPRVTNAHLVPAGQQQRPIPWTSVLKSPSVGGVTTPLFETFAPGGFDKTSVGTIAGRVIEWHMVPDTYLFRVQNKGGTNKDISITLYVTEL